VASVEGDCAKGRNIHYVASKLLLFAQSRQWSGWNLFIEEFAPQLGHMTLKHAAFTAGMAEAHLAKLAALGRDVAFQEGQLILSTGERSTRFYLLLSGSACIEVRAPFYTVCVQVLRPGEAFGWSSFLDHSDTLFQVRAREASNAMCWDGAQLSAMCLKDRELGLELHRRLLGLVAGRLKATEAKLAEFCAVRE